MQVTHTTTVTLNGRERELEVKIDVGAAERDVGIMSDYIDDWQIVAVDGLTADKICAAATRMVEAEYGEEAFVDKLYNEGAVDDAGYDEYEPYDYD